MYQVSCIMCYVSYIVDHTIFITFQIRIRIRIRISLFRNKIRNDFNKFYRYLNNSWKPILWVQPLSHRLPKQQHCSEIINTKNPLVNKIKINKHI